MNDFIRVIAKFIAAFSIGLMALALLLVGLLIWFAATQL